MKFKYYLKDNSTLSMQFEYEGSLLGLYRSAKKQGRAMGMCDFRIGYTTEDGQLHYSLEGDIKLRKDR
jgi:hypothetical protein